jgi:riboflavin synthase
LSAAGRLRACHCGLLSETSAVFTGIVEETGAVVSIKPAAEAIRLTVKMRLCGRGLKKGDSVAVNGGCLTAVSISKKRPDTLVRFDLLKETWIRTNLQFAQPGAAVNLERAMAAGGRFGGHFVTGHIDKWERQGEDHLLDITAPKGILRFVVLKGSIAVDGISLTVSGVTKKGFKLWIIPHTHTVTALRERKVGDDVNLEADLLGKYVEQFCAGRKR